MTVVLMHDTAAVSLAATNPTPAAPPAGAAPIALRQLITDPEVTAALRRHPDGPERDRFVEQALRIGVLALRSAAGEVDGTAVREAGNKILADVAAALQVHTAELTQQVAGTLGRYFDPSSGLLTQRIESVVRKDGELEQLLRTHVGGDESVLARTLVAHLGKDSALLRSLSPDDANGVQAQLARVVERALGEQRERILREFSLDHEESSLSRVVRQLVAGNGRLTEDLKGQVDGIVREFSLDHEDSALSRLVRRVEDASGQIGEHLTLDREDSALSRLRRELAGTLDQMVRRHGEFHAEVRATLASLQARREEEARSTRHGDTFEDALAAVLMREAQRAGDVFSAVGDTTGTISHCKKGDHVTQLGRESAAPGARIVWEAKEDRSYDLEAALAEIVQARKNRDAQIGVFVFSSATAPEGLQRFSRYGDDVVIVWDAADPSSDVFVHIAYSVARALVVRGREADEDTDEAVREIDRAVRAIEKQIDHLDQVRTWAETIRKNGEKISGKVQTMQAVLGKELERLEESVTALKVAEGA